MINSSLVSNLKKAHVKRDKARGRIIGQSNHILHDSKRVIFSLHRADLKKAEEQLIQIEKSINKLQTDLGQSRLEEEGAYRAAMEEYLEAKLFNMWINRIKINKVKGIKVSYDSYLGALSDLAGEIVRYAVNQAAKHNLKEVERAKEDVSELMSHLTEFDFTGYLRTKYDQARGHLRKLEQVNYEVSLRK